MKKQQARLPGAALWHVGTYTDRITRQSCQTSTNLARHVANSDIEHEYPMAQAYKDTISLQKCLVAELMLPESQTLSF